MAAAVICFPARRRMHIARPLTPTQTIGGVVADLEALPQHPDPADIRAIAGRLQTLADRLEGGATA